jgi:NitT/TauT family transport system substrate-binding protein
VGVLGKAAAAVAVALTLSTAGCGGGDADAGKPATEKVTYLTGAGVQGREAYVYVAIEKGYFAAAGFDVEVRPGNGTNQNLQLLQSGQADFAVVDITAALIEYGRGTFTDFTVVSALHQRNLSCIAAIAGKGVAQPRDLAGKRIGYLPGGVVKALFDAYAGRAGVDAKSIKWVNMPAQQMAQNLAAGTIDAATQLVVGAPAIEAAAKGQKVVVLPLSDHLPDLYGNGIAVGRAAATDQPERGVAQGARGRDRGPGRGGPRLRQVPEDPTARGGRGRGAAHGAVRDRWRGAGRARRGADDPQRRVGPWCGRDAEGGQACRRRLVRPGAEGLTCRKPGTAGGRPSRRSACR